MKIILFRFLSAATLVSGLSSQAWSGVCDNKANGWNGTNENGVEDRYFDSDNSDQKCLQSAFGNSSGAVVQTRRETCELGESFTLNSNFSDSRGNQLQSVEVEVSCGRHVGSGGTGGRYVSLHQVGNALLGDRCESWWLRAYDVALDTSSGRYFYLPQNYNSTSVLLNAPESSGLFGCYNDFSSASSCGFTYVNGVFITHRCPVPGVLE